jgi:glucose-6-phosphate dehydrogenase assembly protein OpcA
MAVATKAAEKSQEKRQEKHHDKTHESVRPALSSKARALMEELNTDAAKSHIWVRTQMNAPAQRPWFTDTGGQSGAGTAISDLSWSRLTPWRELTAQFFDAPALAPHLAEITRVAVDYEARAGAVVDRSQALLLVGWLAARLGWRTAGPPSEQPGSTTLCLASATGEPIAVELRPAEPVDDALDRLSALAIECRRARFTIARDDTPDCAVARSEIAGMQPIQRKVRLERLDEADLIGDLLPMP